MGELASFVDELKRLRLLAGSPPLSRLVVVAAGLRRPLARSTLSDKLNAKSLPGWDFVVSYVSACVAYAEEAGSPLPAELADLARWDTAHWRMLRAVDSARANDRLAATAQAEIRRRAGRTPPSAAYVDQPRAWVAEVVPRQLPAAVPHFAGRAAQLTALTRLLSEPTGGPGTVLISAIGGTAGIGKTALAVHWAHQVADRFPDGQLYVNLRGFGGSHGDPGMAETMSPAEAVRGFLEAFGVPPERIPATLAARTGLYRSLLADRRVLILLDNARHADQVRPLLPGSPACLVVVTSRNQLPGLVVGEGARPLVLDPLSTVESRRLLARRLGDDRVAAEPDAVDRIVAASAGLPLALAIVAARAATHPDFSLAALADELRDARGGVDNVRTVFSWSYHSLEPAAASLFRLLGMHAGPDVSAPVAASLAGTPVATVRRPLAELARANLLTEHLPGRYVLHDLLRAYAAELVHTHDPADARRAALRRLLDHYLHTAHTADLLLYQHRDPIDPPSPGPGVTMPDLADRGQAWAWLTIEHRGLLAAIGLAADHGFDIHAWQLAWTVNTFLDRQGKWHDQFTAADTALGAARRGGDRDGAARTHRNLAMACLRLGRYDEAHTQLRRAQDLYAELGDDVGRARTHLNLGILAERQGRYAQALGHARRAFDLFQSAGHDDGQANALNNIGWYHIQLGDYQRALTYCERALRLQQEHGNRYWEAHAWDSLGSAHHHLGDPWRAVDCYQRALTLWREAGERYYEAATLTHFGDARAAVGEPDLARSAWWRALDILGELGHPDADQIRTKLVRPPDGIRLTDVVNVVH